jgi:hypothetical protein
MNFPVDIGHSNYPVADAIRVAAFALGAASLGVVAVVIVAYLAVLRRHRAAVAAGTEKRGWIGLLPKHVVLIALSYVVLDIAALAETIERLREPLTWYGPAYLIANIAGLWAMWDVLGYERRRFQNLSYRGSKRP